MEEPAGSSGRPGARPLCLLPQGALWPVVCGGGVGVLESPVPWMVRGACEQGWVEPDGSLLVSVPSEPRRRQVVSHCTQGDRSSVAQREAWQARGSSVAQREARQARGHPGRIIRAPPVPWQSESPR